jgi:hypothetical protein
MGTRLNVHSDKKALTDHCSVGMWKFLPLPTLGCERDLRCFGQRWEKVFHFVEIRLNLGPMSATIDPLGGS